MKVKAFFSAVVLLFALTSEALAEPKRVLILNPHGREFVPWNEYGRSFREELLRRFPEGVDLYETALATARSGDAEEGPFADYLQALFAKRQLDLVVAVSKSCDPLCSKISTADISIRSRRIHGGRAASSAAGYPDEERCIGCNSQ